MNSITIFTVMAIFYLHLALKIEKWKHKAPRNSRNDSEEPSICLSYEFPVSYLQSIKCNARFVWMNDWGRKEEMQKNFFVSKQFSSETGGGEEKILKKLLQAF